MRTTIIKIAAGTPTKNIKQQRAAIKERARMRGYRAHVQVEYNHRAGAWQLRAQYTKVDW